MHTSIFVAAFAVGALASPSLVKKDCKDTCMTYDQALTVANNFQTLIASYSDALANAVMTPDFEDYSSGVNTLIDSGCNGPQPLDNATFTSRAAFESGQGAQPPIPFEILNLWYACTGPVVMRWKSAQTPEQVVGNIVLETKRGSNSSEPWLIKTTYSEFNSGAWLVNLGVFKPNCSASSSNSTSKRSLPAFGRIM